MGRLLVQGVGKAFKRYRRKWGRLAEWLGLGVHHELHWVLSEISFNVEPGEAVGILGVNGAGKSTLLKIITGTTRATTGTIHSEGRVAALLELGMGFQPEFTGRQNVITAAQLRGLSPEEIAEHMAGIEAFADIGEYIDQPVRVYSSGMQVRLAFSVATAVRPDILIVDEALAVGDVFFQQKCFDRIRGFRDAGTTLLFVSHSPGAVYSLCSRAILLDQGRIALDGPPKEAIDLYNATVLQRRTGGAARMVVQPAPAATPADGAGAPTPAPPVATVPEQGAEEVSPPPAAAAEPEAPARPAAAPGSYFTDAVTIRAVELLREGVPVQAIISEQEVEVSVLADFHESVADPHVGFQLRDARGEALFMTTTDGLRQRPGAVAAGERLEVRFRFRAPIAPGDYSLTAGVATGVTPDGDFTRPLARIQGTRAFSVLPNVEAIRWAGVANLNPTCTFHRVAGAQREIA